MTNRPRLLLVALFVAFVSIIPDADARADEIKVLYALPLQPGLVKLAEEFRQKTGHIITFEIPSAADLAALLGSDRAADILINTPATIDKAVADGKTTGPKVVVGRVGISVVVRKGVPVPDVASVDGLKAAVLGADAVAFNTAGSGQYVQKVFDQLGIGEQIKAKAVRPANGPQTMDHVLNSTGNEIGFGLTPEAYPYGERGVQTVGPLPPSLQTYTVYEGVVLSRTQAPAASARFLEFIATPAARQVLAVTGVLAVESASLQDYPAFFPADSAASPRIASLRRAVESKDPRAVQDFWEEVRRRGSPVVEPLANEPPYSFLTFLWRGTTGTQNVVITDGVATAVGGDDPRASEMMHIDRTDVWYRTYKVRNDARFVYSLSENDPLQLLNDSKRKASPTADPLNPHLLAPRQSYVELPQAPSQETWLRASDAPGKVEKTTFRSPSLGNERDVWVYTPRSFNPGDESYPLLVVFDGASHTTRVPVPTILDNLIQQGRIPPMLAVMVGSLDRDAELSCSTAFSAFVADELVPWMRKNYRATTNPALTVVAGSSLGGLAAAFTGFRHADVFGKVLSQSGSFWWAPDDASQGEWLTRQLAHSDRVPLEFYMEVGKMEIPDQRDTNQHLRDVLEGMGYAVHYQEFNGNHTYLDWRGSFGDGLAALLGRGEGRR